MADMEYKTVPLPASPRKYKGLKNPIDRTARTMTELLNEEARGGWQFVRAERMELEVRTGMLRSKDEVDVTLLIFARQRGEPAAPAANRRMEPVAAPAPASTPAPPPAPAPAAAPAVSQPDPVPTIAQHSDGDRPAMDDAPPPRDPARPAD